MDQKGDKSLELSSEIVCPACGGSLDCPDTVSPNLWCVCSGKVAEKPLWSEEELFWIDYDRNHPR